MTEPTPIRIMLVDDHAMVRTKAVQIGQGDVMVVARDS